jgi:hypothetical protein
MKHIRFSACLVALTALTATACKTDLTALNVNPNNPSTLTPPPAGTLFTNATATTVSRFNGMNLTYNLGSLFAHHIAQVQYVEEDRGHLRAANIDGIDQGTYAGELEDYQKIIGIGKAAASANTWAPAAVMQSWGFQNLTDLWGDIPYTAALKGDVTGGSLAPAYDAQKDIYYGLLKTLTDASAALKAAPSTDLGIGSADIVFKGDNLKWQKLANSLRARMALRMLKADPAKAGTELSAAFGAGVMTSNADIAAVAWPGDGIFDNPVATNFLTRDDHRVSKTLLDTMNALSDPRVPIFAQPAKNTGLYTGLQNGLDVPTAATFMNTTSRPGAIFYPGTTSYGSFGTSAGRKTPSYIMTYAEVAFLQAECAERGLGGLSGAAAYYNAGVTASMTQWGVSAAAAAAYLAQPGIAYKGGATGLQQIGLQKWIALFTQGTEAWAEWRRTGNPSNIAMGPAAYSDVLQVPRRIPYPTGELSVNAVNLAAAIARQGPDLYSTRIWWDKP